MHPLKQTPLVERHLALEASMVDFGGWNMPVQYAKGIVHEHLQTRRSSGLFDVSHMGRFIVSGRDARAFLQYTLTNSAAALELEEGQYTLIANEHGGAVDDAYLYRFVEDAYLLVVNAANRDKDWEHLQRHRDGFDQVVLEDRTEDMAMISLQGPASRDILSGLVDSGRLPEPVRNALSTVVIAGFSVWVARTGYTGEPICFELFVERASAVVLWNRLLERGAEPVGLGARDTLRLEAGLPLYGHELGYDPEGKEIPIFACPLAKFAVSFSDKKGAYVGRRALERQFAAFKRILDRDTSRIEDLPRRILSVEMLDRGIARAGNPVLQGDKRVGYVTSGTMVPFWRQKGEGVLSTLSEETGRRAIALALLDSDLYEGDRVEVEIRGKRVPALIVPYHLRSEAPPFARAITCHPAQPAEIVGSRGDPFRQKVSHLVRRAVDNHRWRQGKCINLIPSEQTPSSLSRLLSVTDPTCRYAEHKPVKAFCEEEVFYYQGTDFIAQVEELLVDEFRDFLGCAQVEARPLSGQMANTAVYSAIVDFINRADRKREQRRIRRVLNNHIIKGGHLSAQPLGALRDFVARDPVLERPAVVNFPVIPDNPYQIDVAACEEILDTYRPELIIFGKSMVLHKEPVAEIRHMVDQMGLDCFLLYDMAHVLGLVGHHFQQPFVEGADIVTGSTHKTYFGTQRGVIGTNYSEQELGFEFWEAVQRRAFPGSTSNHHLGTMLGLLVCAYEMNAFKEEYQPKVLANAKAFARALKDAGLQVAGDPAVSYTETHQVVVDVGYSRGPEVARRLEDNNIVVNYQAAPDEEGFTASGALRMGVQEMTRFGMESDDFTELAGYIRDVVLKGAAIREEVSRFRQRFLQLRYCFSDAETEALLAEVRDLI